MSKKIFLTFLLLISALYLFLRLYNLNTLIGFRMDQGIHLLETKSMFDNHKLSLLGPSTSKTFSGHQFFTGANYYYVLGIVAQLSQWDPLIITTVFIFIEFIFFFFFIIFLKTLFNPFFALSTFFFIAISPYLVVHSRFFWNPHFLIPLSILSIFYLQKFFSQKKLFDLFLSSFFWGFAFACHFTAIFWAIFFAVTLFFSSNFFKIKPYLAIFFGFILGNLPLFLFELRHNFYNFKTFLLVFANSSEFSQITSHYFVFPFLIFLIFFTLLFFKRFKNQKLAKISLFFSLILITLIQFNFIKNYYPINFINGWDFPTQKLVANIISEKCPQNFNIAATMQGDTRAYDLRFLLSIKKCPPAPVDNYQSVDKLFLIAPKNRHPKDETVWEINSFKPFSIKNETILNNYLTLLELVKN